MNKLYVVSKSLLARAQILAVFTNLLVICFEKPEDDVFLRLDEDGLFIVTRQFKPLNVCNLYNNLSIRQDSLSRELLIRAIKIKPDDNILIIDATAGFAKDSALLGLYGYKVIMLEQNPLIATIVYYAIQERLIAADNLQLVFTDSLKYFKSYPDIKPYAIYLDPMFKAQDKALAKKDMQIIQILTKDTMNLDNELFNAVYSRCKKLIVKRDNKQSALVKTPLPSYCKNGKTIRYDIYLC